ncbi:IPT/TIG domain-containing protein [Nonomuraea sp. NPDC049158]|uniref:IPT/TIG domain-containing protein n=1 Tax=Nonomuraea sp. NPDC049158 TaxID=3155649 RepID=UPI0033D99D20
MRHGKAHTWAASDGHAPASAAAGGTDLTIRDCNFTPGSTVTVGGTAATAVIVMDDTTIRCKNQAHAVGAVALVVITDAGAATKANGFTYA